MKRKEKHGSGLLIGKQLLQTSNRLDPGAEGQAAGRGSFGTFLAAKKSTRISKKVAEINFMLDYPVKPGNDGEDGLPGSTFALRATARQASRAMTGVVAGSGFDFDLDYKNKA